MGTPSSTAFATGPIFLAAFVGFTIWALIGAKGLKQKLITLAIISGWMVAGFGVGVLLGGPNTLGAQLAAHFVSVFGAVGAFGCTRRNKHLAKKRAAVEPVSSNAA